MHGGLSPELKSLEQIKRVARPTDVPDSGLLCDLLWADPDKDISGWGENDRGVSYTFGPDCVTDFLQKHDLDLICRAHQVTKHTCVMSHVPVQLLRHPVLHQPLHMLLPLQGSTLWHLGQKLKQPSFSDQLLYHHAAGC